MAMQVSSNGLNSLKKREELRLNAYLDSAGVPTIGWGCTFYENGAKVRLGETITQARAQTLFNFHVGLAASDVNRLISAPLTQGQFDALTSFRFNVGTGNFSSSTLRKQVNANPNNIDLIAAEFRKWKYETVNGVKKVSQGLINRREEEIAMYLSGAVSSNFFFWIVLVIAVAILIKKRKRRNK